MTPFPETEVMTIKRLEVALRKKDFKLLKDGAYKLHEKFHGGYEFQFLDVLSDLLDEVRGGEDIPEETKNILVPTIEDILNANSKIYNSSSQQNTISPLTSLSYNVSSQDDSTNENKKQMSAFDAFSPKTTQPEQKNSEYTENQYSSKPFTEFESSQNEYQQNNAQAETVQATAVLEPEENNFQENIDEYEAKTKTISIIYNQNNSYEKTKNILRYRELIKKAENQIDLYEVLNLIKEINTQSNTNVSELKGILDKLNSKDHSINLITNSSSANLIQLLQTSDISYSLIDSQDDKKLNLLPLMGLTNLFKCSSCGEEILNNSSILTSMVLECPKCKNPMFPSFYTVSDKSCEIDMNCYNQATIALSNSDIWLIINPSQEEMISKNLLKTSLKISSNTKEIFIIDKDINTREMYKNMFLDIKNDININTQINVIEDFFNLID